MQECSSTQECCRPAQDVAPSVCSLVGSSRSEHCLACVYRFSKLVFSKNLIGAHVRLLPVEDAALGGDVCPMFVFCKGFACGDICFVGRDIDRIACAFIHTAREPLKRNDLDGQEDREEDCKQCKHLHPFLGVHLSCIDHAGNDKEDHRDHRRICHPCAKDTQEDRKSPCAHDTNEDEYTDTDGVPFLCTIATVEPFCDGQ